MMARISSIALAAAAGIVAMPLAAATPAAGNYDVMLTIYEGGAQVAAPRLIVRGGETATFLQADERLSLRLTATPGADNHVAIASLISAWSPQGITNHSTTIDLLADGVPGTLAFPSTDPATGAVRQMRIDFRVLPAD
jgi:hypothetical protein